MIITRDIDLTAFNDVYVAGETLVEPAEELTNGMWPRTLVFWMTAFYVALFIIRPWEQLFPWLATIRFERTYALCMIAVVMASRGLRIRSDLQTVAVGLFFGALIVSAVCASSPELAWLGIYRYLTLVVFYIILVSAIRTLYELVFMVAFYILTMGIYLAKSQWEYWIHDAGAWNQGVSRLSGIENTFGQFNSLAMSIVVSLPMLLFLYKIRHEFTSGWPEQWQKWFGRGLVAYFLLAVISLVMTNSRSGMVSFILFVVLVALWHGSLGRKVLYLLFAALLLGSIWLVMPEKSKNRFRTIWDPESGPANAQTSAEGRIAGFKAGMTMFEQDPITGVGIGCFLTYRIRYIDEIPLQAHNLIGQLLGETGLLGAAGFVLLIGATFLNCHTLKTIGKDSSNRTLEILYEFGVAITMSVVLLFFDGLFGHNVYRFNWLWLAAFCLLAVEFAWEIASRGTMGEDYDSFEDGLCSSISKPNVGLIE